MLHLNLRGYLPHIAEVTSLISELPMKPFLVSLTETFLSKAVEQVKLEDTRSWRGATEKDDGVEECSFLFWTNIFSELH